MKVIFIKDLKNQGKTGDIKEVKDGYGTNFLIKNGYAIKATEGSVTRLKVENAECELHEKLLIKDKQKEAKELAKLVLEFSAKAGTDSRIFGTISPKQIKESLDRLGYKIDKKLIHIDHAIDTIGVHNVNIKLHKQVIATLKVKVIAK